jgi:hypothetical protein
MPGGIAIARLPTDVMRVVFEHLWDESDDLCRSIRVCKQWRVSVYSYLPLTMRKSMGSSITRRKIPSPFSTRK